MKTSIIVIILWATSFLMYGQQTGDFSITDGKLTVDYSSPSLMTKTAVDNSSGAFGTHGIGGLNAGDVHIRGFWGVVIDKNGGGLGESASYTNGVNPAGGSFAVRTRTSSTAFRTDFIIRNNGYVGIGTVNPDAKLAVKGIVHAEEVRVDTSVPVPDYVFDSNYILMPLETIKQYVEEHNHLPEVPSANEFEQNGVNLGEMNLLLLKKVEELTLYVIELKKEIDGLKTNNK